MKKILLSLTFIAAMLTSCVSDYGELNYAGKDAIDVVIGVGASELAQSRAAQSDMNSGLGAIDNFSEDEWAKYDIRYMLEVYDVTENYVNLDTPVRKREVQTYDSYQETKFELRLIPNRTYKFVVWADFVEQGSKEDLNYNTTNLKSITRIGDVKPMDESMDAYFVQENIEIVNSLPKQLVLKRPFGKLRVITTDIEDVNFGTTPSKVDVTFYNHPTFVSLNALTGNAETTVETVTYSYSIAKDAPYTAGYDADSKCQTIFADYILAKSMGSQEVNFTLAVTDQANRPIRNHTFDTQIPLERNKLTTLYGNLLTTATEFNISVDDDFDGEYNINADAEQLAQPVVAASVEGNVVALSWDAVENADYYVVAYGTASERVEATSVTYALDYATKYTFTVQACSDDTVHYLASEVATVEVETEAEPAPESPEYIYLKPNGNWMQANARFAVYTWSNTDTTKWVDMTDSNGDGIYEVSKSELFGNIIFCRMNPDAQDNNWNNKWNQTVDLTLPADGTNMYTVANGAWDYGAGTWSYFDPNANVKVEVTATLTFDDKAKRTVFTSSQQVWVENEITLTNDKAASTNAVADYAKPARFYSGSKITVAAPGEIATIVFDCGSSSSSYATALKNSIGSAAIVSEDKVTVALDGSSTEFVIAKLTAQIRLDAMTVTYWK